MHNYNLMIKEYKTYIMYKYFLYNSTAIVIIVMAMILARLKYTEINT